MMLFLSCLSFKTNTFRSDYARLLQRWFFVLLTMTRWMKRAAMTRLMKKAAPAKPGGTPPGFADQSRLHAGCFSSFPRTAYLLKTVQL